MLFKLDVGFDVLDSEANFIHGISWVHPNLHAEYRAGGFCQPQASQVSR
jgi:hypothetical protein